MVLRTVAGRRTGEHASDLESWLVQLQGCPGVSRTLVATCGNVQHADEPATWFYVEADAASALARRRCLSCGDVHDVLDSAEHWTPTRMWACPNCGQSIAEVGAGMHLASGDETTGENAATEAPDDSDTQRVTWVALAARCVDCGTIDGLTDFCLDPTPADDVTARI